MSVLVEAVCLVVPRAALDSAYPGGATAFVDDAASQPHVRYAVADDRLVCVSASEGSALRPEIARLRERGLTWCAERRSVDFVVVDYETGPSLPCDWIAVQRHPHGFTRAWDASHAPGDLVTPGDWRLEETWRLVRSDVRDGGDWMRLASDEDGLETWIDFASGEQRQTLPERPRVVQGHSPAANDPGLPLLDCPLEFVRMSLEVWRLPFRVDFEHRCVCVPIEVTAIGRVEVMVSQVADDDDVLRCDAVLPDRVAAADVPAVRVLADRLNGRHPWLVVGLDEETRSVHVRTCFIAPIDASIFDEIECALARAVRTASRVHRAISVVTDRHGRP